MDRNLEPSLLSFVEGHRTQNIACRPDSTKHIFTGGFTIVLNVASQPSYLMGICLVVTDQTARVDGSLPKIGKPHTGQKPLLVAACECEFKAKLIVRFRDTIHGIQGRCFPTGFYTVLVA